ncbi:MAG TPA: hypothetical protein VEI97_01280 [bacterium]|nr:hypothetical protein [bacterium]
MGLAPPRPPLVDNKAKPTVKLSGNHLLIAVENAYTVTPTPL